MYVCIVNHHGEILVHHNSNANPETFLKVIAPYREDMVVAVACMCTWSWLADLCQRAGMAFVLGPALSRKASHGGKAKNDRIDAQNIAVLRRRMHFRRKRAALLTHVQNTQSQYNLPDMGKKISLQGAPRRRG
jgi:transposase